MLKPLRILRTEFPGRPVFDAAASHALLRSVAAGAVGESLRLYWPDDVVVFSLLDARRRGFGRAVEEAARLGFSSVLRLAGGHAAVFHGDVLAFSWVQRADEPRTGIHARYAAIAQLTRRTFGRLGVDARVGEVPGEFCPGEYSVNARGRVKLMGVGQRVIRGAAHMGGVMMFGGAARSREVLDVVYEALDLDWEPATVGSLESEVPGLTREALLEALQEEIARDYDATVSDFEPATLAAAQDLESWHETDGRALSSARVAKVPGSKTVAAESSNSA